METVGDWEEPENFEELIYQLYKGFPNGMLREDVVKKIVVKESQRKELVESGYLTRELHSSEEKGDYYYYNLGPKGLDLVSSWEMEKLTKRMTGLTVLIAFLAIFELVIGLIGLLG